MDSDKSRRRGRRPRRQMISLFDFRGQLTRGKTRIRLDFPQSRSKGSFQGRYALLRRGDYLSVPRADSRGKSLGYRNSYGLSRHKVVVGESSTAQRWETAWAVTRCSIYGKLA
jgi:hypothetical protein